MQVELSWSRMKRFTECEIKFKVLTKYASSKFTSSIDISFHFSTLHLTFHHFISLFNTSSHFSSFHLAFHHFISLFIISSHFFTIHFIFSQLISFRKSSSHFSTLSRLQEYRTFQNHSSFKIQSLILNIWLKTRIQIMHKNNAIKLFEC